jgi:hypothetical protein
MKRHTLIIRRGTVGHPWDPRNRPWWHDGALWRRPSLAGLREVARLEVAPFVPPFPLPRSYEFYVEFAFHRFSPLARLHTEVKDLTWEERPTVARLTFTAPDIHRWGSE